MSPEKALQRVQNKYGDKYDYFDCVVGGEYYIYRLISEGEFHLFNLSLHTEIELQDVICKTCVLFPEALDIDEMFAGDVTELANIISNQSCVALEDRAALLQMYREEMDDLDNQMISIIMKTFQGYKLSELESMDYPTLYRLYTRAEWVLSRLENADIMNFIDPVQLINEAIMPAVPETETIEENETPEKPVEETSSKMGRPLQDVLRELESKESIPVTSKRKQMTKEEEKAFRDFQAKFPELHMEADAMFTGAKSISASTVAPALRTPNGH